MNVNEQPVAFNGVCRWHPAPLTLFSFYMNSSLVFPELEGDAEEEGGREPVLCGERHREAQTSSEHRETISFCLCMHPNRNPLPGTPKEREEAARALQALLMPRMLPELCC